MEKARLNNNELSVVAVEVAVAGRDMEASDGRIFSCIAAVTE